MIAVVQRSARPGDIAVVERDIPQPGPGEVLVKMIAAGLCHTDVAVVTGVQMVQAGYHPTYPYAMGHEYFGQVEAVGDGVSSVSVGDKVVGSAHTSCRECRRCREGRSMLCENLNIIGLDYDGAWAEYFLAPERNLAVVPQDMPDTLAVLAEPFAVALHATDLAELRGGERVAVIGPGSVGLLLVGALAGHDVTLIGRDEDAEALERGLRVGATSTLTTSQVGDEHQGAFDVIFEAAGHHAAVELATRLADKAARIVLVGLPSHTAQIDTAELARREIRMLGSRAYDLSTWRSLPERLAAAPGLAELVTHEFGLQDIHQAIDLVEDPRSLKVIVRPEAQ